jgi:glycosyltransferase involved in cell wall biosynthesis
MRTAVFSIVSPNYRHYARVLMDSLRRVHPDWERFVLLVGGSADCLLPTDPDAFTTVPLDALPLPHAQQFCFRYTILELNTAVKPWMFEHLFALGFDRVVYFDPDIVVYSELAELDATAFITLTPHLTGSIPGDDHPSERAILQVGTYNLGFLAVTRHPQLQRFLAWWQEKLEFQCVADIERGLFVDQKWMDLVPGLFPDVAILRHDGYNVAYWNLRQRNVVGHTVNDQPLRFFHFSGLDRAMPEMVSRHDGRLTLVEAGDARKLIEDYRAALHAAGATSSRNAPYAFARFADGTRLPDAARIAYRNSPELQAAAGDDPFQNPQLFRGLYDRSTRSERMAHVAARAYQLLSRARPLVLLFPRSLRTAAREMLLNRRETPPQQRTPELPSGLNVVGYVTRDTGVGESARLCAKACAAAGLPNELIDIDATDPLAQHPVHRVSLYHVNADRTLAVHNQLPQLFEASAYNIGCWHWELPELPDEWIAAAAPLDEIWAPSAFVQSAISRKVTIPVVHMPHGVEVTELEPCAPEELGVPRGRFTFLCMFDLDSVMERKNPLGAIEAFRRAFPTESSAALLVKAGRAANHRDEYEGLQRRLRDVPNVYLTDRMLPRARVNGLIAASDAVVSLHRSEGFGLILAEAMCLGKPVIATGWSGNMDFMNVANSCPVRYDLVTLERAYGPYAAGQQWAEPDLDHAAELMQRVASDAAYREAIGRSASETMRTQFSPKAAGMRFIQRLRNAGVPAGWPGGVPPPLP